MSMKIVVHRTTDAPKIFESKSDGEVLDVVVDSGDLVVQHYHVGDPFLVKHTLAAFAKGTWSLVERF